LRFDVVGRFSPDGHAVTKPAPAGVTAVRFMITADTRRDLVGQLLGTARQAPP
jgi:hypothetical protein